MEHNSKFLKHFEVCAQGMSKEEEAQLTYRTRIWLRDVHPDLEDDTTIIEAVKAGWVMSRMHASTSPERTNDTTYFVVYRVGDTLHRATVTCPPIKSMRDVAMIEVKLSQSAHHNDAVFLLHWSRFE